jgi:hypothetical protein
MLYMDFFRWILASRGSHGVVAVCEIAILAAWVRGSDGDLESTAKARMIDFMECECRGTAQEGDTVEEPTR